MVLIEKPVKTCKPVLSLKELANTQDVEFCRVSRFDMPIPPRKMPIRNMTVIEDAQWRRPTRFEVAMRPISKFFGM